METTASFGYWIRRQRKALDLTQQALADQVGCSLAAIKKIEGDERRPSRQIAERIADVLNVWGDQREIFLEVARGLRSVDQLSLAREPVAQARPSGTVTFLFTDIEGSTKLAQEHADEMQTLLTRHREILNQAIEAHHGYIFQIVGDSFSAAFDNALNALKAASEAQRILQKETWLPAPVRVRMGIHTGTAHLAEDPSIEGPYAGYATLALTQRIMSAAHGGQILLSHATENLFQGSLPKDMSLLDLGEHKFKDIFQPVRVFQVLAPDLQKEYPALQALEVFQNNLPVQLTSFIGRERELSELKPLLMATHLLTLTGPGGTGKTRLALQLAVEALKEFTHGVWLVELAPLADPSLVAQTIASTLGVHEQPGRTILDALTDHVRAKNLLLILDNCEHLVQTCAQIAEDLLRLAPRLKILATSREALGIAGEIAYRVPSLPLPDPVQLHDLDALAQNDCVHLFVDRALATYPRFRLKEKNAPAVAEICRRLDGIPLAIELAAARTKVFPPEELAARLDDRFRLLTGGSRTALERHQTLFALIEWSHNLLSEPERVLLRRLSVFAGGWSFDAAQEVCGEGLGDEVLDLVTHLIDKSLVAVEEETEEARHRLPETIRQYARDKLYESGEAELIRDRHLDFFLRFAEAAESKLRSTNQIEWLERIDIEHDNLRTALAWSSERGQSGLELQLAGALSSFWLLRGYFSEGLNWLEHALVLSEHEQRERVPVGEYTPIRAESNAAQRAKAHFGAAWIQLLTLNLRSAHKSVEESLRLWRELGDKWWIAAALDLFGFIMAAQGDFQTSRVCLEEGVMLAREVEDHGLLAGCLVHFGGALQRTDVDTARSVLEEGVALARKAGAKGVLSDGLRELGSVYFLQGNLTAAVTLAEESLAEARASGTIGRVVLALFRLAVVSYTQNELAKAKGYCFELWAIDQETGFAMAAAFALFGFGVVARGSGEPGRGVRLLAAFEAFLDQSGAKFHTSSEGDAMGMVYQQALEKAQAQLGPEAFQVAWTEGQQMSLEEALAMATENASEDSNITKSDG